MVAMAAKRIMDLMAAEFSLNGHSLKATCSLGIAIYPDHGEDVEPSSSMLMQQCIPRRIVGGTLSNFSPTA
jgi:GGDEF domain-containing protein